MSRGDLNVEIITRDFNRMLEELAAIDPKIEFADVVKGAAERVIMGALRATKAADLARMRENFNAKEYTTFNGKRYMLLNRYRDSLWREIAAHRQARLEHKIAARGLSKKSWLHVAKSFGAALESVPAFVNAANSRGADFPQNGESREITSHVNYALEIINSSPIVSAAGGRSALLRAMRGETRYFQTNMEKRAFRTLESRARKYPQIFVTRSG